MTADRGFVFPCGCSGPGHQRGCGEGWDRIPDAPTSELFPEAATTSATIAELETSQVPQVPSAQVAAATNGAPEE